MSDRQINTSTMWLEINAKENKLSQMVEPARKAFESDLANAAGVATVWSGHFGATGIDSKHLFVYFVVPTRTQADALINSNAWEHLRAQLLSRLAANGYPVASLQDDWLGLFSQQACDEEYGGNWYHFFK